MRAKDKMQVTLKVSTTRPHVLVQCCPIKVAAGGLIVSSLCGGSSPQCPAGVCGATNDSVRVDTGINSMVLTLKESHNIMFTTLTGNNLLVQMRAKGNKSLNFRDILEICQR